MLRFAFLAILPFAAAFGAGDNRPGAATCEPAEQDKDGTECNPCVQRLEVEEQEWANKKILETLVDIPFDGDIQEKFGDSTPSYPTLVKADPEAPNILLWLMDDTGFGHLSPYGGLTPTPTIQKLADNGLIYTGFHTTALCSPSRASILSGRNHHRLGLGSHQLSNFGFPGYNGYVPASAGSVAKILKAAGYSTCFVGKWDHTPYAETTMAGPFEHWPTGEGFEHFYGFMAADINNFFPVMWKGHWPVHHNYSDTEYHASTAMADEAITLIRNIKGGNPDKPIFMMWATGAMHAPHHAPPSYIEERKGKYDMGWDESRKMVFANQKKLGLFKDDAIMLESNPGIPKWEDLSEKEQKLFLKQMEVFGAQLIHVDEQFGRIVDALEEMGQLDNTMVIVTSDNGASAEGGLAGTFNEIIMLNGVAGTPIELNYEKQEEWGSATTYNHYHAGWAQSGNTPFKFYKQMVHRGGSADPLVVSWPNGIKQAGVRNQFHHIIDIAATAIEVGKAKFLPSLDGIPQMPLDGVSFAYTFNDPEAKGQHTSQYFEMFGNRAFYEDGWKCVTVHTNRTGPWILAGVGDFAEDVWELYNVVEDPTEMNDLSKEEPDRLEKCKANFVAAAKENDVYPMYDDMLARVTDAFSRSAKVGKVDFYPPVFRVHEAVSPPLKNTDFTIDGAFVCEDGCKGVIASCGGYTGGYTIFVQDNKLTFAYNLMGIATYSATSNEDVKQGENTFNFDFKMDGDFANGKGTLSGVGTLSLNGAEASEKVELPIQMPSFFSMDETFNLGIDPATSVAKLFYESPNRFENGKISKVSFETQMRDIDGDVVNEVQFKNNLEKALQNVLEQKKRNQGN